MRIAARFFPSRFSRQLRLQLRLRKTVGNITLYQYHLNSVFSRLWLKEKEETSQSCFFLFYKGVSLERCGNFFVVGIITSSTNQLRHSTPPEELFLRMQAPQGGGDSELPATKDGLEDDVHVRIHKSHLIYKPLGI